MEIKDLSISDLLSYYNACVTIITDIERLSNNSYAQLTNGQYASDYRKIGEKRLTIMDEIKRRIFSLNDEN